MSLDAGYEYTTDECCSEIEVVEDGGILVSRAAAVAASPPIPTSPRSTMDTTIPYHHQQELELDQLQQFDNSKLHYPPRFDRSKYSLMDTAVDEDEEMDFHHHRHPQQSQQQRQTVDEEGIEVPFEFLSIFDTFLFGCASGCEPCATTGCVVQKPREGILKNGRNSNNTNKSLAAEPMMKRTVSFSQLEIKEFKMSLGDHPCSSTGPPVMLDWDSQPLLERVVSLDEYERLRSPRRARNKLRLSYRDRKSVLEDQQGYTTEEVNRAWAEAIKIRQQRLETLHRSPLMNTLDDVYESWQRKCHRAAEAVGIV
jgi:hypothetical protein